jgi:hypothetical protein
MGMGGMGGMKFGGPRGGGQQQGGASASQFMKTLNAPPGAGPGGIKPPPMGLDASMLGGAEPEEGKKKKGVHTRTEFVILFVWKEPWSELMSKEEGAPPTSAPPASPGGLGGMNMGSGVR